MRFVILAAGVAVGGNRGLAQEPEAEAFRILPHRAETTHYIVVGTAPPAVLLRLGRDMDFMYEAYDREFRGIFAEPDAEQDKRKSKSSRKKRRPSSKRRGNQRQTATAPAHVGPKHHLVILADENDFRTWTQQYIPKALPWVDAFFTASLRAVVIHLKEDGLEGAYPLLFHEGFHQFLFQYVPDAPVWLDEGLAVHYEQARPSRNGWRFPPHEGRFRFCARKLDARQLTPLNQLFAMDQKTFYGGQMRHDPEGEQAGQHYSEAYTLLYMMLQNAEAKALLQGYVRDLAKREGEDVMAITAKHFPPRVISRLQEAWLQTVRRY
jgi:hypothetical protein